MLYYVDVMVFVTVETDVVVCVTVLVAVESVETDVVVCVTVLVAVESVCVTVFVVVEPPSP